jgi:uncharacterized protein YbaR (Trm112 family)
MHVELTDLFRCPVPHRESWLVVAADRTEARVILDGVLGCPECGAEYAIRDGVALFDERSAQRTSARGAHDEKDPEFPFRIAALLNATDGSATLAFIGMSVLVARTIQSFVPVRGVVVDAPDEEHAPSALLSHDAPLAVLRTFGGLPVANGALHGVYAAIGEPAAYTAALRPGGRMVAPAESAVPEDITELARDANHWVGEKAAVVVPSALVELKRR